MIKLILVEDERATREGLLKHTPWNQIGIDRVEEARNGVEALEKSEWLEPDIVLTDVSMPRMDGIQLATRLRERYPQCKIVFLSGYSDKEYLKSAIKLNALNYIEKPIDENELIATLSKAVFQYKSERDQKAKDERMQDQVRRNTDLVRQKLAVELIKSDVDPAELKGTFEDAGVEYRTDRYYTTAVVKFNWNRALTHNEKESCRSLLSSKIYNILGELSDGFVSGYLDSELYLVHFKERIQPVQHWEGKLNVLREKIMAESQGNYAVTIGVGLPVYGLAGLKNSFNLAMKAIQMQFYEGVNTIIFSSSLSARESGNPLLDDAFLAAFGEYLGGDKRKEALRLLNEYYSGLAASKVSDNGMIRNRYLKLLFDLHSMAKKRGITLTDEEDLYGYLWRSISGMDTLEKIHLFLVDQVKVFFKLVEDKEAYGRNVYEIMKFIQNQYPNQKLSVRLIAESQNFSESYLCTFFKKITGKTLNDYITEVRIEKSKELLKDRNLKIYEIAKKVGYDNENYFAKVFRKYENASPSEFRERFFL